MAADVSSGISRAILGMTLAEYAGALGKHPQAVRKDYARMMRTGEGVELPPALHRVNDAGTVKFCLPVGTFTGNGPAAGKELETESVIIPMTSYRASSWHTLCLSSQVGCRMGCTFCETGRMGLLRNLTAGEIVQQRLVARQIRMETLRADGTPADHAPQGPHPTGRAMRGYQYFGDGIQNIVFMGMGEPLDNLDEVAQAIRVLSDPAGLDFPMSQICVSTVGRIDGLRKLAELKWPNLRLAISLTAATDELRDKLVPINKGMPLAELQRAVLDYPMNRRGYWLIEYVLIKGVNDSLADADAVAAWCKPLRCVVNLIPYNPQRGAAYETPSDETVLAFMKQLKTHKIFTKRRVTHGTDLMGACGQLGNPEIRRKSELKVLGN